MKRGVTQLHDTTFFEEKCNKRKTYSEISIWLCNEKNVMDLVYIISNPNLYDWTVDDLWDFVISKILNRSSNMDTFSQIIKDMSLELFAKLWKPFLHNIYKHHKANRLSTFDYNILLSRFSITKDIIDTYENIETVKSNKWRTKSVVKNIIELDYIDSIRENTLIWKNNEITKDYDKLSSSVKWAKEKRYFDEFLVKLIQNNPELIYSKSYVNHSNSIICAPEIIELFDIFKAFKEWKISNYDEKLKESWITENDFQVYILTKLWKVSITSINRMWIKIKQYTII